MYSIVIATRLIYNVHVCNHNLCTEERKLACIGDYFNDYEMLKSADIAACPSNAAQGIKDICDIVTCSNDEGAIAGLISALCGE